MLSRLEALTAVRQDMVLETTLATLTHAPRISAWRKAGWRVELIYLRLPSVEHSIARVRRRVEQGGHGIPEPDLRRRFQRSLDYLDQVYKPIVDDWQVWSSGDEGRELLDWGPR
jgi:predicted ABC-type ATPase